MAAKAEIESGAAGSRRESMIKWYAVAALVGLLTVGAALVIGNQDYLRFRIKCHHYKQGNDVPYFNVGYGDRRDELFFRGRSEQEMRDLLGDPRVIVDQDPYGYASVSDWLEHLELTPNGTERALWYGEDRPEHFPHDESYNVYFLLRDDRVIDCRALYP